jgi:hypothetical protein
LEIFRSELRMLCDFGVVVWKHVRNSRESVDSAIADAADVSARLQLRRNCKPRRLATR